MINKAKGQFILSFYTDLINFMSRINHRLNTFFMQKESHTDNPQISKIMCYVCYCLQHVIKEIDFNKLCTFTSQSCKR